MSNRMDRLARRAEGRTNERQPRPGERLDYDRQEQRLVLYARDGSRLGQSARFVRDDNAHLGHRIDDLAGGGVFIYAYQHGVKVA